MRKVFAHLLAGFKKFSEKLLGFVKKHFLVLVTLLALFLFIRRELAGPVVTIEVLPLPKSIIETGFSETGLSGRIIEEISRIDYDNRENIGFLSGRKASSRFRPGDEKELPQLEILGTKVSIKDAILWLRPVFHKEPTRIKIILTRSDNAIDAQLTVCFERGYTAQHVVHQDARKIDALIKEIAEKILSDIDPAKLAIYLHSLNHRKEFQSVLEDCIREQYAEEKARCLATWASIDFKEAHWQRAVEKYQLARFWKPEWGPALTGLGDIEESQGRYRNAEAYYQQALKTDSKSSALHTSQAYLANDRGDWQRALREAEKSIEPGQRGASGHAFLGELLYGMQRDKEADEHFLKAVESDPANASTYVTWGRALYGRGFISEAEKRFRIAQKLRPTNAAVYNEWGNALFSAGNLEAAVEKHRKAVELYPQRAELRSNLALDLLDTGKYREATLRFAEAMKLAPAAWWIQSNWGLLLAFQGKMHDAESKWISAAQMNPASPDPYNEWGTFLFKQKNYVEAAKRHRQAVEIDPGNIYSRVNLASDLLELDRYGDAEKELQEAMKVNPQAWLVMSKWGTVLAWWAVSEQSTDLERQSRMKAAEEKWTAAARMNPCSPDPYNDWGNFLYQQKDYVNAEKQHWQAIDSDPGSIDSRVNLVYDLHELGRDNDAEKILQEVLEENPNAWWVLTKLGTVLAWQGKMKSAEAKWTAANRLNPGSSDSYNDRGTVLYDQKDYVNAEKQHRQAVEKSPWNVDIRMNHVNDLIELGRYRDAERKLQEAVTINPNAWWLLSKLGTVLARQGKMKLAEAKWTAATRLNPASPGSYKERGDFLYDQTDFVNAEKQHRQAVKMDPRDADSRVGLAKDLVALGRYSDAETELQEAMKVNPYAWWVLSKWGVVLARWAVSEQSTDLERQNRLRAAEEKWTAAARMNPSSPHPYNDWGNFLYGQKDYLNAEKQHRQAVVIDPKNVDSRLNLADDLIELGRYRDAEKELQQAMAVNPNAWWVESRWGTVLANQGKMKSAKVKWGAAALKNPRSPDPSNQWGNFLYEKGKYKEAATQHGHAVKIDPRNVDLHLNLAFDLLEPGGYPDAETELQEAMKVNPHAWWVLSKWGMVLAWWAVSKQSTDLERQSRMKAAEEKWIAAAHMNPRSSDPYNDWGNFLYDQHDYMNAEIRHKEALTIDPWNVEIRLQLALDLIGRGASAEAEAEFQKAMQINPCAWWVLSRWASVLSDNNRVQEAIAKWEEAVSINPGDSKTWELLGDEFMKVKSYAKAFDMYSKAFNLTDDKAIRAKLRKAEARKSGR